MSVYRTSDPPPPIEREYAMEEAVDDLAARVVTWTRWIDRAGVALGIAVGGGMLWALRGDASWGVQRLVYVVMALGTIVIARALRVVLVRAALARWIAERARSSHVSASELGHRVRMALTVQPR